MDRLLTCIAALLALAGPTQAAGVPLDAFDYANDAAAQAVWKPSEETAPPTAMAREDGTALRLAADFTATSPSRRSVVDRDLNLDLNQWDRLTLDLYVEDPGLVSSFSLYFRSGPGWYSGGFRAMRRGWQTVEFTRASFRTEGTPAGWDKVDGIRLGGWRGAPRAGFFAFDNLVGYRESIVVISGTNTVKAQGPEADGVVQYAELVYQRLREAGLAAGSIGDEQVEAGGLAGRSIAILAYSPNCSEAEVAELAKFTAAGGKVLAFYAMPDSLLQVLGLKRAGSVVSEDGAKLVTIRFEAPEIQGLPTSVAQRSWRTALVEPAEPRAKIIGWWHGPDGERVGSAFALSDVGAWMGHVLLEDDPGGKSQLLLAVLGHFRPELWEQVAAARLRGPERIGLLDGREALRQSLGRDGTPAAAVAKLAEEQRLRDQAAAQVQAKQYAVAVTQCAAADEALREAWLLAQPTRTTEFRAVWNHSGTGAWPGDWERSMRNLRDCGLNAVLPNVLWAGRAQFPSEFLPLDPVAEKLGDQLAAAVAAGKKYGIEVHPWKVNWNLSRTPQAFRDRLAAEGRLMIDRNGQVQEWLEPSDPRNQDLEVATMVEMARKYDVDGIHFDYIRYPGDQSYGPAVRERFERFLGRPLANWPDDVRKPEIQPRWVQWRCDNISTVVRRVAEEVRRIKPHCRISAAVFSNYPNCRIDVGQDWVYWAQQGWVDFLCPMDYTESDSNHAAIISSQLRHIAGAVPLYPGIGVTASGSTLTVDRVAGQIDLTRRTGADGFTIFNYGGSVPEGILPGLGRGALREPAATGCHGPSYGFDLGPAGDGSLYARLAKAGETVKVTVARRPDPAGRTFEAVTGELVIEDAYGGQVKKIGDLPTAAPVSVEFVAQPGLWRVAARGQARVAGRAVPFVSRSLVVQVGDLPADVANLF